MGVFRASPGKVIAAISVDTADPLLSAGIPHDLLAPRREEGGRGAGSLVPKTDGSAVGAEPKSGRSTRLLAIAFT